MGTEIKIKSSLTGNELFAYKQNCSTIRHTLEAAVKGSAYLGNASLRGADLTNAQLAYAMLCGANLTNAQLVGANLRGADLMNVNFCGADLRGANLTNAQLVGVKTNDKTCLPDFLIVPQVGSFVAWKKVCSRIVQLEIPANARRVSTPVGRKCRAEFVKVLAIDGGFKEISKTIASRTVYRVGDITWPDKYNDDWRIECTHGIHFFMTRKEAEEWPQ